MSRRLVTGLVTGVTVPLLMVASTGTAFAATGTGPLRAAKRVAQADITKRLQTLDADVRTVSRAASLTAAHRDALSAIVSSDAGSLRDLRTEVSKETTLAGVKADVSSIFGLRVYALLGPQVTTVTRADAIIAAASRVTSTSSTIVTSTAYAKAQLAQAKTLLDDASTIAATASSTALALKPADLPNGLTPLTLVEARSSLAAASADITAAQRLIAAIRAHNSDS